MSIISWIELLGKKDLTALEIQNLKDFLETFIILELDSSIAEKAAVLRRKGIKMGDSIIAATAWQWASALVSRDRVFQGIEEIEVINPWKK
ncbi:MAG: PIN domain-containing protein [bacterium]|nr:PIN domain-containing protein [bacterium]